MTTITAEVEYLSCAETAKLVRAALKRAYPTTKFYVQSKTYSMGASINVGWTDGPTVKMVDEVVQQFRGSEFDGMIDLKVDREHYLLPDGTAALAHTHGTVGSGGVLPKEQHFSPSPAARRVSFGADHIFCSRMYSNEILREKCEVYVREHFPNHPEIHMASTLAWRTMERINYLAGDTIEDGYRRAILREEDDVSRAPTDRVHEVGDQLCR